ncbi:hypothetical protein HAX54_025440 [Datura stramonium]|uniref:Uncharacterized protein n=1 Tax=Datura stramonium TaxID=4076 RepID=A0ABS8S7K2_DATST|nr:hypothetical protein [Datura stramonium]
MSDYTFVNLRWYHDGEGISEETLNGEVDGEEHFTRAHATSCAATKASSTTTRVTTFGTTTDRATTNGDFPDLGPVGSNFMDEEGSDCSTDDSVESKGRLVGDDKEDYSSDMYEEVRELRAEKRTF